MAKLNSFIVLFSLLRIPTMQSQLLLWLIPMRRKSSLRSIKTSLSCSQAFRSISIIWQTSFPPRISRNTTNCSSIHSATTLLRTARSTAKARDLIICFSIISTTQLAKFNFTQAPRPISTLLALPPSSTNSVHLPAFSIAAGAAEAVLA